MKTNNIEIRDKKRESGSEGRVTRWLITQF